jgi:Coenzyme PQQ synthesis protein D (PqqD)
MNIKTSVTFLDKILSVDIDSEMVLLDMKSEKYFGFDEVGASIWREMQKNNSLAGVYEVLLEEYNVEPEVLRRDLLDFAKQLEARGMITLKPAP